MKLTIKKYKDGMTFRVSGGSKAKREEVAEAICKLVKGGKPADNVAAFEEPLPQCAPGEPNC